MKLLLDADIITYHAVYSSEGSTIAGLIDKLDSIMGSIIYNLEHEEGLIFDYQGYLTGTGNFRHEISDIYKAQRPKEKPITLKLARNYLVDNYNVSVVDGIEADDAIATEANRIGYENAIIVSIDKDFMQIPCTIYNYQKQTWKVVSEWEAKVNFYTQVLTGDTADNIKGLHGIGPKKAAKILEGCEDEVALYKACLDAYEGDSERILKGANLLWLRRHEGQVWLPPEARVIDQV